MSSFILQEFKFELTDRCLLSCRHCSSSAGTDKFVTVSREDCLRVLMEAAEIGVGKVSFSGGEPLLWGPLEDAVERAVTLGLDVAVYSSGTAPNIETKIRNLGKAGVGRLIFSMHGASADCHEVVTRVHDSFESLVTAIQCAGDEGISVEVHFVPLAINYHDLAAVVELAQKLGATHTSVLRFVPHGRGKADIQNRLKRVQNAELRKTIFHLRAAGYAVRTGSPYNFMCFSDTPTCGAGRDRLVVRPDLAIVPCYAFRSVKAQDIVGTDEFSRLDKWSLGECWIFSPYLKLLRTMKSDVKTWPCSDCEILTKCGEGCPAQKYLIFGKLSGVPDPDCLMNHGASRGCRK